MGTKVIDQILTKMLHGSAEEKHYIYNESDIILECKLCRNLFRALTGFILHRKSLCLKPIEKSVSVSAYDQSMRSETFKNVTFITSVSSQDPAQQQQRQQQQQQQQQKDLTSEFVDANDLSTADHFQYLENYVSQINETMESKSNLKAVLNLTQEGIADSNDVVQDNMADDRSKLLEDYVVQIASPVEALENTDATRKNRIVLTDINSPQTAVMVSSPQGSSDSDSSSGSRTCHKTISHSQTNEFNMNINSDSNCHEQTSPSPTSLLKMVSTDSESVTNALDNSLEQDDLSSQSFAAAQQILASSIGAMTSAKNINLTSTNSSSSKKRKQVEVITEPLSSNGNSSATQIVIENNLDSKNVIEIDDLDSLEERVTESLSLESLVYVPVDESSTLDQNLLQQQQQLSKNQQQQHYLCSYCPNTLIYDAYLPFRRHLASVHGIQHDPSDPSGQSLSSDSKQSSATGAVGSERSSQKSSEDIVLELADFQNLQCRKCKHSFTQRCSLRRHILEIHSEKLGYYSCPFCTNKVWFRYFRTFLAHLKNLHGFQKDQIYRIHRNLQKNSWVEFGSEQLPADGNGSRNFHF